MQNYIEQMLGCAIKPKDFDISKNFPMYLKNEYTYREYIIFEQGCLFAEPVFFNLSKYKKHKQKLEELTGLKVVLDLKNITQYQRSALIKENIPFIVDNSQIYLPFLMTCLTEKYTEKQAVNKFTPLTQLVFLYIFYNNCSMTATEISKKLGCTVMSANRAYTALVNSGLYSYKSDGRKKYLVTEKSKSELLRCAEPFLINPAEKTAYFHIAKDLSQYLKSGIYALAEKTMLDCSENDKCYALSRDDFKKLDGTIDAENYLSVGGVRAEIWRYDPGLLSIDGNVDDISLILSMQGEKDERVVSEIEKLRSKYEW